jgi:hypothetical protein
MSDASIHIQPPVAGFKSKFSPEAPAILNVRSFLALDLPTPPFVF